MERIQFKVSGKIITLEDDPVVIERFRNDDMFTVEFLQKAIREERLKIFGIYSKEENIEIIRLIEPSDDVEASQTDDMIHQPMEYSTSDVENSVTNKQNWNLQATKLLLSLYKENVCNLGKTMKLKNKKNLWRLISEEMAKEGYSFTAVQIENRYKTLDRGYKEMVINNKKTGRNRASCNFERELFEINQNRKSVFPEFVLDASGDGQESSEVRKNTIANSDSYTNNSSFSHNERSDSEDQHFRKTKKPRTILEELKKFRELRENEIRLKEEKEAGKKEFRQNLLELERAKLEAYKERNKILQLYYETEKSNVDKK